MWVVVWLLLLTTGISFATQECKDIAKVLAYIATTTDPIEGSSSRYYKEDNDGSVLWSNEATPVTFSLELLPSPSIAPVALSSSSTPPSLSSAVDSTLWQRSRDNAVSTTARSNIWLRPRHRSFLSTMRSSGPDLSSMTEAELAQYFIEHRYTQEQILDNPKLYFNPAFVKIAKQLPRYDEFVDKFYHRYRTYSLWDEIPDRLSGNYQSGMQDLFTKLYRECELKQVCSL